MCLSSISYLSRSQYCNFPANKLTPTIPNTNQMRNNINATLINPPMLVSKALTTLCKAELCEINLINRRVLSCLSILNWYKCIEVLSIRSKIEVTIIKKSNWFQESRR